MWDGVEKDCFWFGLVDRVGKGQRRGGGRGGRGGIRVPEGRVCGMFPSVWLRLVLIEAL